MDTNGRAEHFGKVQIVAYIYSRTLKTPVTYRLYGEQNSV